MDDHPPPDARDRADEGRPVFDDRYELIEILGSGGAAEVWRARDRKLSRDVAVKVLSGPAARDATHRKRIEREARALAAIAHPNVVSVYDYGEHVKEGADPVPYVVMELVDGPDLARHLASTGRLEPDEASRLVYAVLRGVTQGHAVGIVHGDLKPANILVGPEGPKVGDFGVARILAEETGTTTVAATPTYAAPEVVRGDRPTQASDVYSASCIAFETLAGHPPFQGKNSWEVSRRHLEDPVPNLGDLRPDVPEPVALAITAGLAKDPADRPRSAADLAAAFEGENVTVATAPPPDTAVTVPVRREPTQVLPAARRAPSRKGRILGGIRRVPVGLALAALAVLLLLGMKDGATATARVPDFVGMTAEDAVTFAQDRGFDVVAQQVDEGGQAGTVVRQDPGPGGLLERGGRISLAVTEGAPQVIVPDVVGEGTEAAIEALHAAGLVDAPLNYRLDVDAPLGTVVRSDPPPGVRVDEGSEVDLFVSAVEADQVGEEDEGRGNGNAGNENEGNEGEGRRGPPDERGRGEDD